MGCCQLTESSAASSAASSTSSCSSAGIACGMLFSVVSEQCVESSVDMLVLLSPTKVVHMFVDGALRRNDLIIVSWHCVYRVHVPLCSCVSENVWR